MIKIQAMRFVSIFVLSAFVAAIEPDRAPIIEGQWIQGGLLRGKVAPGSQVTVLGQKPFVDTQGRFVFGLGRDAKPKVSITVEAPNEEKAVYEYAVTQRDYPTQRIEGVAQKYVEPPPEVTKRIKDEAGLVWRARQKTSNTAFFREGFVWPMSGPITGVYGSQRVFNGVPKRPHFGLDIAGPTGTLVNAPAPGIVRLAHADMYYSGGTLIVDHGQGLSSTFIHLSEILVEEGAQVDSGQAIAKAGATGRATGPHLDWRINWFSQRLDPFPLLPPRVDESSPAGP